MAKRIVYNAGFRGVDGIVIYVAKRVSGAVARTALRRVSNLKQYKGKFGFMAQAMSFKV